MHSTNLNTAIELLNKTDSTCVFCNGEVILTDKRRGVKPLLDLLENGTDVAGFSVADKVVGKAAAYLYCLLQVQSLFARVISKPALSVLENAGIAVKFDILVDAIQNRTKDGFCPMEQAVWEIHDPASAHLAILKKLKELTQ